jgi:hypothetical protein
MQGRIEDEIQILKVMRRLDMALEQFYSI